MHPRLAGSGRCNGSRAFGPSCAASARRGWPRPRPRSITGRCGGTREGRKNMGTHRIAAIPGDGIGQEVIAAGLEVLDALQARAPDLRLEVQTFDWGSEHYRRTGRMMPENGLEQLRGF